MSSAAHIRSIQALDDLRSALARYHSDVKQTLQSANLDMRKSLEFFARRERHWQEKVRAAQAEVERAEHAFASCRAQVYSDGEGHVYQPPCNEERAAAERARAEAQRAREQLAIVRNLVQRVEQASSDYTEAARRFEMTLSNEIPRADGTLDRQLAALHAYIATHAPSGGMGAILGAALGAVGGARTTAEPAAPELEHLPLEPTRTHAAPNSAANDASGAIRQTRVPGIALVPLSSIDVSDSTVRSPADFLKVSQAEMVSGFQKLNETVLPQLHSGATADDFSALDSRLNLRYRDGYRRVYDAFFGDTAIRIERVGDSFRVINGFHRLSVARELGLDEVPAYITGQ